MVNHSIHRFFNLVMPVTEITPDTVKFGMAVSSQFVRIEFDLDSEDDTDPELPFAPIHPCSVVLNGVVNSDMSRLSDIFIDIV